MSEGAEAAKKAERTALIGIAIAAVLGLIFAFLGSSGGETTGPIPTFALLVIVAFGMNIAAFIPSFLARTDHYYDLTGSITYLTVTTIAFVTTDTYALEPFSPRCLSTSGLADSEHSCTRG